MGKINGSRYTQVKGTSSSPYHRPHKSRDEQPSQLGGQGIQEGQPCINDYVAADEVECCECYHNFKTSGCDPGKIDQNSRVVFPVTFLILSICYWTYYILITDVSVEELKLQDLKAITGLDEWNHVTTIMYTVFAMKHFKIPVLYIQFQLYYSHVKRKALSIFLTRDVITHCYSSHGIRVYPTL